MTELRERVQQGLLETYVIESRIGAGGMGVVFRAHDAVVVTIRGERISPENLSELAEFQGRIEISRRLSALPELQIARHRSVVLS